MIAVILAGGGGTRLWPMSRTKTPKQFQNLLGKTSLIQDTYLRISKIFPKDKIFISTNLGYLNLIKKQLPKIPRQNYILEKEKRNTAPAIGLAAKTILEKFGNEIVTTFASDHLIEKQKNFEKAVLSSQKAVKMHPDFIGVIGVKPTVPHTGLGYIKRGKELGRIDSLTIYKVDKFVEKPDLKTAQEYLKSGQYFWNVSYFTFMPKRMLEVIDIHQPDIVRHLKGGDWVKMPDLAIDYVIEQLKEVLLVSADLGWTDIGSWEVLKDILTSKTGQHTVVRGHHIGHKTSNSLIYAQDKLVATVGIKDLLIIDTPDVILICNKKNAQDVKKIVEQLKKQKKHKYL